MRKMKNEMRISMLALSIALTLCITAIAESDSVGNLSRETDLSINGLSLQDLLDANHVNYTNLSQRKQSGRPEGAVHTLMVPITVLIQCFAWATMIPIPITATGYCSTPGGHPITDRMGSSASVWT